MSLANDATEYKPVQEQNTSTGGVSIHRRREAPSKMTTFGCKVTWVLLALAVTTLVLAFHSFSKNEEIHKMDDKNQVAATGYQWIPDVENNEPSHSNKSYHKAPKLRSGTIRDGPDKMGHMTIYIRKSTHPVDSDFSSIRIPVAVYSRRRFPLRGPFIYYSPWPSMYTDGITKQTMLTFEGKVYLLPAMTNSRGELISVGNLVALGHVRFNKRDNLISPFSVLSLFIETPINGKGIPKFSRSTGTFTDSIKINYDSYDQVKYDEKTGYIEDDYESESYDYMNDKRRRRRKGTTTAQSNYQPDIPELIWKPCNDPFLASSGAECSSLLVPLDHNRPSGQKIRLALSRLKHTVSEDKYQGVMLINPGGPGGSGLQFAILGNYVPNGVGSYYDWIGFDPRGVGLSEPALSCELNFFEPGRKTYIPYSQEIEDFWLRKSENYAKACEKNGPLLDYMKTIDIVKDMEWIRLGLRQDQINYYGYSYGTAIGQLYATLYPKRVRRMVLDSNVDPSFTTYKSQLSQIEGFDRNLNLWFNWLAQNNDYFGLGSTQCEVIEKWTETIKVLANSPINNIIGPNEWADIFVYTAYFEFLWLDFGETFANWTNDQQASSVMRLYNQFVVSSNDNAYVAYLATICTDHYWPKIWDSVRLDHWRLYSKYPIHTWLAAWYNGPCLFWRQQSGYLINIDGSEVNDILLIGQTLDAATPFQGNIEVRRRFPKARLISVPDGTTHSSSLTGLLSCVDESVAKYLATGELPPRSTTEEVDATCPYMKLTALSMAKTAKANKNIDLLSKHGLYPGKRPGSRRP